MGKKHGRFPSSSASDSKNYKERCLADFLERRPLQPDSQVTATFLATHAGAKTLNEITAIEELFERIFSASPGCATRMPQSVFRVDTNTWKLLETLKGIMDSMNSVAEVYGWPDKHSQSISSLGDCRLLAKALADRGAKGALRFAESVDVPKPPAVPEEPSGRMCPRPSPFFPDSHNFHLHEGHGEMDGAASSSGVTSMERLRSLLLGDMHVERIRSAFDAFERQNADMLEFKSRWKEQVHEMIQIIEGFAAGLTGSPAG